MQTQLLDQYPSAQLRVYTVWLPMLWSDSREMWDGTIMPDARVVQYWDGELKMGQWFARGLDGYQGIAWDVYYLFGPDATWENLPAPLLGSGRTIYSQHETLAIQIRTLLKK